MSGALRCYLIGVSLEKGSLPKCFHPKYLWVFIFGVAEKTFSLKGKVKGKP
jgi:hypothetical protein